jgi:hypothetical protein
MTCIAGINPGSVNPGLAFISSTSESACTKDLPTCNGQVDAVSFTRRLEQMKPDKIFVEHVSARPLQGISSTFRPVQFVAPTVWKRHFHLGREKEESRAKALQLFPAQAADFARKRDHDRAEACLLAAYGLKTSRSTSPEAFVKVSVDKYSLKESYFEGIKASF